MSKRLGLFFRIATLAIITMVVAGSELKHLTPRGGPAPPVCPPTGCTGGGHGGK